MTMYGQIMRKPELSHPSKLQKMQNFDPTHTSERDQRPRINTSFDTKTTLKNRMHQNYLKKVDMNDTFTTNNQNLGNNSFVISNAIRLTPRQMNRKFGNFFNKFN